MKKTSKQKTLGQVMTPRSVVLKMLDDIGYQGKETLTKTIMEPSFGDGAFLLEILSRIIFAGRKEGLPDSEILKTIKNNVYGIEKAPELYQTANKRIQDLFLEYHLPMIDWEGNLICGDALLKYKKFRNQFDYVVGNPPYVRIHHIDEECRKIIKNFQFSKGIADLYIVFYEIGLEMLHDKGKLIYITPNSFMKNITEKSFREYLLREKYLVSIQDFRSSSVFDVNTYVCICLLDKNQNRKDFSIRYKELNKDFQVLAQNSYAYDSFSEEMREGKWNLCSRENASFLRENSKRPYKVKDIAVVQNGIVTLRDRIFVVKAYENKECSIPYLGKHTDSLHIVYVRTKQGSIHLMESAILHRCVKASKYDGNLSNDYILYPYKENVWQGLPEKQKEKRAASPIPFSEEELKENYPYAYAYLSSHYEELIKRDMDTSSQWFSFGRSQGLSHMGSKKIVFKHILNRYQPVIVPYLLEEDVVVYSGLFTTVREDRKEDSNSDTDNLFVQKLQTTLQIYSSKDFARYCSLLGKDKSGGYVEVNTKTISNYGFSLSSIEET